MVHFSIYYPEIQCSLIYICTAYIDSKELFYHNIGNDIKSTPYLFLKSGNNEYVLSFTRWGTTPTQQIILFSHDLSRPWKILKMSKNSQEKFGFKSKIQYSKSFHIVFSFQNETLQKWATTTICLRFFFQ